MSVSKSIRVLIIPYISMVGILFLLSIMQEAFVTGRFSWSIIFIDFLMDAVFLTIAFCFFYVFLRRLFVRGDIIKEQEERYRRLLDNMMEGIQVISPDWKCIYLNDAAVKHNRYTREEMLGQSIIEKYPGLEHTPFFRQMEQCMNNRTVARIENDFTFPDGYTGSFALCLEPIPEGIFVLSMDISEKKARDRERQQRMRDTQELLFKISHEVRHPVVGLQGLSNLLDDELVSAEELASISQMMKQSITLLDQRTRELSSYISALHLGDEE